jgi:protoheme IX farnesyltransferase
MSRPLAWISAAGAFVELGKPRVSLLAAVAAGAGCALSGPGGLAAAGPVSAGVLLLACGAAALNEFQERTDDAKMERTARRPLPSGRLTPGQALVFSLIAGLLGLAILAAGPGAAPALGVVTAILYNGVYTPLKKVTPFAALPGALAGAIPPAIGWTYGGGALADVRIFALCLVLFVWQVPHSWLVLMEDRGGTEAAGLRPFPDRLSGVQLRRVISHWVLGTAVCSLLLSWGAALQAPLTRGALLAASLWLALQALSFRLKPGAKALSLFHRMNLFMLGALLLAVLDPILK